MLRYKQFLESSKSPDFWDIIPNSVKELHKLFKASGKKLFVVGGSIRDFLNNDKPKDFDLCTDATPEDVLKIIGNRWETTLQGKAFFVVVVYTEDQPSGMEIATFREDVYGDLLGKTRNPQVKFSTIEKDVERRDIPYNALFYDLEKKSIIDLVGGIEDLKNGVTRFVGDPYMRIKEDSLRILRIARFTARYKFSIEEKTGKAIHDSKEQLSIITPNRIWEELYKAYEQVKDYSLYLKYLDEYELWDYIFPGIKINRDIVKCSDISIYLANLFKYNDIGTFNSKLGSKLVQDFKMPDNANKPIVRTILFLIWFQSFKPDQIKKFYDKKNSYQISNSTILEWIKISNLKDNYYTKFVEYKPSVSTEDLMSKGFSGKALGDEIERIEIANFKSLLN